MIFESALLSVTQGLVGLTSLWDGDMTVPLTLNTYLQIRRISWSFTLVYRWRMISQGFNLAMCENDVWRNSGVRRIDCLVFYECTCKFEVSMGYVALCMFVYSDASQLGGFFYCLFMFAWFPVKSGGLVGKEFSDVDYIFSSNATAKDTLRCV